MGNNLRNLRESKGWTHAQAAEAFGYSESGYKKLERGERRLRLDHAIRARGVYECSLPEVIGDDPVDDMPASLTPEMIELFERIPPEFSGDVYRLLEDQANLIQRVGSRQNGDSQDSEAPPESPSSQRASGSPDSPA